jgi:hypothetical protein
MFSESVSGLVIFLCGRLLFNLIYTHNVADYITLLLLKIYFFTNTNFTSVQAAYVGTVIKMSV